MNISSKPCLVVAVFSIMALVAAASGAAGMPSAAGQHSTVTSYTQPGTGTGQPSNYNGIHLVPTQSGTGKNVPNQAGTPGQGSSGSPSYTMEQTLSDQAQESTIAFDGLAFLTGEACSDSFLPPGKVADYAGFQYLRDNDATEMGHNTDFVTRAADNVLSILNDDQRAQFIALSNTEAPLTAQYGYMRFPLMKAFRAQLEGNVPSGSSGLDRAAVMAYSAKLYDVDASISIQRAKTYASVIRSLNQTQRAYLDKMASGGMKTWPVADASDALSKSGQDNSVAMRTYASEMFAWYAGDVESDVYFCPERQATYFGSFYMKDRPAMGNPDYSISTTLTGDYGQSFLDILTSAQREQVTSLVDLQRSDLNEIVAKRTAIATELRTALSGDTIDENLVRSLSARYGELDGEISYYYATHFADVAKTTTTEQKKKMVALRNLDGYTCSGAYLYSQSISMPQNIPSDFLFGVGQYDSTAMNTWLQGLQTSTTSPSPAPTTKVATPKVTGVAPKPTIPMTTPRAGVTNAVPVRTYSQNTPATTPTKIMAVPTRVLSGWQQQENSVSKFLSDLIFPSKTSPASKPAIPGNTGVKTGSFKLSRDVGKEGGVLPDEYSCDGAGSSPALSWSGAPAGTTEYALMMTTIPVDGQTKWNWVLYGIPAGTTGLSKNGAGVGITGTGSHGTVMQYDPPCSEGPGAKTYTFTLYALSESPALPGNPEQVTGPVLSNAISSITLGTASLNLTHARA